MENVVIYGVNRFVGFQLCCYYLEQGVNVVGYTHPAHEEEDTLQEEMLLYLGRNANFSCEEMSGNLDVTHIHEQTLAVFFCFFDGGDFYHRSLVKTRIRDVHQWLMRALNHCVEKGTKTIFVSSLAVFNKQQQKITEETKPNPVTAEGKVYYHLEKVFQEHTSELSSAVVFRFPSLYGPWQPVSAAYQNAIVHKKKEVNSIKEDTRNLLYIEDAVEAIRLCVEKNEISGILHVVSNEENAWRVGAEALQLKNEVQKTNNPFVSTKVKNELGFRPKVQVTKGVQNQLNHSRQLFAHEIF
ncbi:NAD-dependent epimerase/dehydratase family protein [Priestia koreensis]|uniref:NAD-dependent epimerase/dehydratase domain-containing protein n=1 Tax=Priestia koreensis TaxID=284581 RepID=A0A0M0LGV0_9BACI|nr:NAD(P)-dependent oxidoreductase [Priestia koreensis]KOO50284.1 hypothetical protein AMD01_00535 [Priestia koreensis]